MTAELLASPCLPRPPPTQPAAVKLRRSEHYVPPFFWRWPFQPGAKPEPRQRSPLTGRMGGEGGLTDAFQRRNHTQTLRSRIVCRLYAFWVAIAMGPPLVFGDSARAAGSNWQRLPRDGNFGVFRVALGRCGFRKGAKSRPKGENIVLRSCSWPPVFCTNSVLRCKAAGGVL